MRKFFKLGDISAFIGSLGLSASLFYLAFVLPEAPASESAGWLHWVIGAMSLVLSVLALIGGLASLKVCHKLYRPNLRKDSHKWLAVVELVGGGVLAVMSGFGLTGLWDPVPMVLPMVVTGAPFGIFAIGYGIYLLKAEPAPDSFTIA